MRTHWRRWLAAGALALLAACGAQPDPARPALWRVEAPDGGPEAGRAWLFGTIHALSHPADWQSPTITAALADSDRVVLEIRDVADSAALARQFAEIARTSGAPPLSARVEPALRPRLAALLRKEGLADGGFAETKTWAAALMLARSGEGADDRENGIDRAVLAAAPGKPVAELEGTRAQLAIFDALPESEQRDLLDEVVREGHLEPGDDADLEAAWRTGAMDKIAAETETGLLADPELRAALFTGRNRAWTRQIAAMLRNGARPFVAVGAAHMAGPEGLPALLAAEGFKVSRIQ